MSILNIKRGYLLVLLLASLLPGSAAAQELDGDGWRFGLGLAYLATGGNSETSSLGFTANHEWRSDLWQFLSGLEAIRAEEERTLSAERYSALARAERKFTPVLGVTGGWQGEQNRFAGIDHRSTFDLGLGWQALDTPEWKIDTVASAAWNYEKPILDESQTNAGLLLMARSVYEFSENASTTQMIRLEPNVEDFDDFRAQLRVGLRASLTQLFGIQLAYEARYDAQPVEGFEKTDTMATVSLVMNLIRRAGS
jgi:putative salt-induced outer membrane protein YdiY